MGGFLKTIVTVIAAMIITISTASINSDGHLVISMSDGSIIDAGMVRGEDGKDGKDGNDGKDGTGIEDVYLNDEGNLIITLTDGTVKNVGKVVGSDGTNGTDGKDGMNGKDGIDGKNGVDGKDGLTPSIGENGNWFIGEEDTGVKAGTTEFIYDDEGKGTVLIAYVGHEPTVVIPEKTTEISYGAFQNNYCVNQITVSNNVQIIGSNAFCNCRNLKSIILSDNLVSLN